MNMSDIPSLLGVQSLPHINISSLMPTNVPRIQYMSVWTYNLPVWWATFDLLAYCLVEPTKLWVGYPPNSCWDISVWATVVHHAVISILGFLNATTPVTRIQCSTRAGRPGCGRVGPGQGRRRGRGSGPPPRPSGRSPSSGSAAPLSADLLRTSDCRIPSRLSPNCGGARGEEEWVSKLRGLWKHRGFPPAANERSHFKKACRCKYIKFSFVYQGFSTDGAASEWTH